MTRVLTTMMLAMVLFCGAGPSLATVLSGQRTFTYEAVALPVVDDDPAQARPLGIGPAANGGAAVDLRLKIQQFSSAVDMYVIILSSLDTSVVFNMKPDGSVQPIPVKDVYQALLSGEAEPWRKMTAPDSVDETLFSLPASSIPAGTYTVALLVTPRRSLDSFMLWMTDFSIPLSPPDPGKGLALYYPFSEGTGTILHDHSDNNLHGTILGGRWASGPASGYAISFNGLTGEADLPSRAADLVGSLKQGTISVWFYYEGIPLGNAVSPVLYLGENGFNNFLVIEVGQNSLSNEKLYFTVAAYGKLILCFDSGVNLTQGRWYHFAAVVSDAGNTGYLNGVEMAQRHYNAGNAGTMKFFADVPFRNVFSLGRGTTLAARSNSRFFTFKGGIGETRIYDRPLSAEEVRFLYEMR
ncbi:MAG TPA: LamG domain-containing protein [Dissulfurispiraceae bacterium]|nr:LamG domain-containing protein [Dissulfurispiraceae bacterium]